MAILELDRLVKIYPGNVKALSGITMKLEKGEVFGLLGPNGAGKTSLIKIITGFAEQNSGDIRIFGRIPDWTLRKKTGYLPEKIAIHSFLSPVEFLKLSGNLSGMPKDRIGSAITEVLAKVKLSDRKHSKVGTFSKGMMQRLGLAAAILNKPDLLLLDEPGSGLDPGGIVELREIILEEKKRGATILINSHRLAEVEKVCDRVGIIHKGNLISHGRLSDLKSGSKKISFTLGNPEIAISEKLADKGFKTERSGSLFEVHYENEEGARLLPALIVEAGGDILKYEKQAETLEEIFMRLVND